MREIKFRAWTSDKEMVEIQQLNFTTDDKGETIVNWRNGWQGGNIIMQYTGLKDKNGKEIYEGDLVRWGHGNDVHEVVFGKIGYDGEWNGLTGFGLKSWASGDYLELVYYFEPEELEVIGNIYENPELVK